MNEHPGGISASLAVILSAAAGLAVGNLYWAQPLLSVIAEDLGVLASQSGFLVTATQAGYALGILLIVPLGDVMQRKKLLSAVMAMTALTLIACAAAPSFGLLAAALAVLGLFTVSGQIILPLCGDLASEADRGRIVGIVSSGITAGILFSRLFSGLAADLWGWRGVYLTAAILNTVMIAVIYYCLPKAPVQAEISYGQLLKGVFTCIKRYPVMRGILLKQGMIFGIAFNIFWTALTFLLSGEPFSYTTFQIGLVSLAGLTGAVSGARLGALQDKGLGGVGMAVFIGMSIVCMTLAAFSGAAILFIVCIAAVFSLAIQGVSVLSQAQLFALSDSERSRLNTAFVVSNFLFSAAGSSLAAFLWGAGGWKAAALGAASASLLALTVHLLEQGKRSIFVRERGAKAVL
ncbi:MFS transporter [bacterium]|nr:MFS transporter [bacterium]